MDVRTTNIWLRRPDRVLRAWDMVWVCLYHREVLKSAHASHSVDTGRLVEDGSQQVSTKYSLPLLYRTPSVQEPGAVIGQNPPLSNDSAWFLYTWRPV